MRSFITLSCKFFFVLQLYYIIIKILYIIMIKKIFDKEKCLFYFKIISKEILANC